MKTKVKKILIGNGLIGRAISRKIEFNAIFTTKNRHALMGNQSDEIFIAAPSFKMRSPSMDWQACLELIELLQTCKKTAKVFVIIPNKFYTIRHYWLVQHRLEMVEQLKHHFKTVYTVVLPHIFGTGVYYNSILSQIEYSADELQWYFIDDLGEDVYKIEDKKNKIHLSSPPIENGELFFNSTFSRPKKYTRFLKEDELSGLSKIKYVKAVKYIKSKFNEKYFRYRN